MSKLKKSKQKVKLNEEELINQIARRPILYDRSLKTYRKLSLRHQYWREVGKQMNVSADDCRRRWRSLRDSFNKRYKQANGLPVKWPFYKQMSFIAPYLDNNSDEIDEQLLADFADNSEDAEFCEDLKTSKVEADNNLKETQVQFVQATPLKNFTLLETNEDLKQNNVATMITSTSNITTPVVSTEDNYRLREDSTTSNQTEQSDPDSNEKFLLSCAPVLRRLSARKNALVRLKIQQLLFEIEFEAHD